MHVYIYIYVFMSWVPVAPPPPPNGNGPPGDAPLPCGMWGGVWETRGEGIPPRPVVCGLWGGCAVLCCAVRTCVHAWTHYLILQLAGPPGLGYHIMGGEGEAEGPGTYI